MPAAELTYQDNYPTQLDCKVSRHKTIW